MGASTYESVKVLDEDKKRLSEIAAETGLPEIECVGCAVDGWSRLTKTVRDRIALGRLAKRARRRRDRAA